MAGSSASPRTAANRSSSPAAWHAHAGWPVSPVHRDDLVVRRHPERVELLGGAPGHVAVAVEPDHGRGVEQQPGGRARIGDRQMVDARRQHRVRSGEVSFSVVGAGAHPDQRPSPS
ncbi:MULTISPECIES: hypothetical protein [unclassified Nonomuraea]|uniref:hypothetical protein n=1 Tax=unclassified Nonomuraea TaxID=2593643 RepID=UPI0034114F08